jgi:hypothetical protein
MNDAKKEITDLQDELRKSQSSYKQKIKDYFKERPDDQPFGCKKARPSDDMEQFLLLISYCLDAGDTELLEEFGVKPVAASPATTLATTDYKKYLRACEKGLQRSKRGLEEDCWRKLTKLFSNLSGLTVNNDQLTQQRQT